MKLKELEQKFEEYCKSQKLTIEMSHFEGDKYISAKPFTVFLKGSDARLGDYYAIAVNLPSGGIKLMVGYSSRSEMFGWLDGALSLSINTQIHSLKNQYRKTA